MSLKTGEKFVAENLNNGEELAVGGVSQEQRYAANGAVIEDVRVSPAIAVGLDTLSVPEALRQRILACQTEDNWDDDEAIGVTLQACEAAICFLQAVREHAPTLPIPNVSPSLDGTVGLYWRNGNSHLIVCPAPASDSAFYQYERVGTVSVHGTESIRETFNRVLTFFKPDHAEPS